MNPRIDARLQRDLDAKGFDKVSELGCRHYALKFDEFNRRCVAWISCQLELARARARYDHDEQETVEEYQDQLAQCRQLAREVSARVHAEPNELAPMPPALNPGSDQSDDMTIDKNKRAWSEKIRGKLQFSYWIHARLGLFILINTDVDRKVVSYETTGIFKSEVDENELSELLVKGRKLTMKMLNEAEEICKHKAVEARVSVDKLQGPLPMQDFVLDGRSWTILNQGRGIFYDCELRSRVFLSVLVVLDEIKDAFISVGGRLHTEKTETKFKVNELLKTNSAATVENLRAFVAVLAPKKAVTARVAGEQDGLVPRHEFSANGSHWSVEEGESSHLYKTKVAANTWLLINVENNLIESVWLEDALMRRRPSKANDRLHEFLTRGPRPIATQDAFKTIVKIASRDRSFDLVALSSMTALEIIQARVDFEKDVINNANEMPSVIKVCKGELNRHASKSSHTYFGHLHNCCNEPVHVSVRFDIRFSALYIFLEGNLMASKRCSLRFPFTRRALTDYIEAELCDVID